MTVSGDRPDLGRRYKDDDVVFLTWISGVSPEPEYSAEALARLPDRELLERLHQAMQRTIYVGQGSRKIEAVDPRVYPEWWNNYSFVWNEAARRGYRVGDLSRVLRSLGTKSGSWRKLWEDLGKPENWNPDGEPAWKRFERIVAKLHGLAADDWAVTANDSVTDRTTGTPRQIDLTLRFRRGFYDFLVVVECRDHKERISIGDVEAFVEKVRGVNGQLGVMVASGGFESGALKKAQFHGIRLYTLSEAHDVDWDQLTRQAVSTWPFPEEVTFDPVDPSAFASAPTGTPMGFGDMSICDQTGTEVERLPILLIRLAEQIVREAIPLPLRLRVVFNPPAVLKIDRLGVSTSVKGVEIIFRLAQHFRAVSVEIPRPVRRCQYRNAITDEGSEFTLEE